MRISAACRRFRVGFKGHPGTPIMLIFMGVGFIVGLQRDIWAALGGVGVMVVFFGPMYLWEAYSRGKKNESANEKIQDAADAGVHGNFRYKPK